jgi:hypothetical protein
LRYLGEWYGKAYDEGEIAAHYPDRSRRVALGWLAGANQSVRLVPADVLAWSRDDQALPVLLDDPYLVKRQFGGDVNRPLRSLVADGAQPIAPPPELPPGSAWPKPARSRS